MAEKKLQKAFVKKLIPARKPDIHKGLAGEVLLIACSSGMTGAGALAGKSALRVGAGLVRIGVPESLRNFVDSMNPETITIGLSETPEGTISGAALPKIRTFLSKSDVLALGPGLSTHPETVKLVRDLILEVKNGNTPIIMDADSLNAVSEDPDILRGGKAEIVITPHPGEMSRIIKKSIDEIQASRANFAKNFAKNFGVITVLKGANTVIANPSGEVFINPTGNPGMASAGMGDVLTGAIAGLIAQGVKPFSAALAAVYIHGKAGDAAAKKRGQHGIIASDIIEELPLVIKSLGG